ncbi:hypothetical protein CYMTET_3801, partial [Cymbomonas tetramitiformis]
GSGGGFFMENSILSLNASLIANNTALQGGGAVFAHFGVVNISHSGVTHNRALIAGGILISGSTLYFEHSNFERNALDVLEANLTSLEADEVNAFVQSHCDYLPCGGGISLVDSAGMLNSCAIKENQASEGGGIHIAVSSVDMSRCVIANNAAVGSNGGGVLCDESSFLRMSDCHCSFNSAFEEGGGVFLTMCKSVISNTTFENNTASNGGGLMKMDAVADCSLTNLSFTDNAASSYGGAIYILTATEYHLANGSHEHPEADIDFNGIAFESNRATKGSCVYYDTSFTLHFPNCTNCECPNQTFASSPVSFQLEAPVGNVLDVLTIR